MNRRHLEIMLGSVVLLIGGSVVVGGLESWDDEDGFCFGERRCNDWECVAAYEHCFPCSSATGLVEFCGLDNNDGCSGFQVDDVCGVTATGVCAYNLICISYPPTGSEADCVSDICYDW